MGYYLKQFYFLVGSGVQDQLDALAIPPTPNEINEQQHITNATAGGSASATATAAGASTVGMGCQQCMGLSQLSFAASTMPPVTVQSHVNSLHLIGNRNITEALSNFTEQAQASAQQEGGADHQVSSGTFQDGGQQQHSIAISVGLNEVKDEDLVEPK